MQVLKDWEAKLKDKYTVVGQVSARLLLPSADTHVRHPNSCPPPPCPPAQLVPTPDYTLTELAHHDGSDPGRPILLAVRGTVFDVSAGRAFYGPDGMYPFGGRECARALATMSTELGDCVADVEGLSAAEMDTLRDWQAKFWQKYPVVGRVVAGAAAGRSGG